MKHQTQPDQSNMCGQTCLAMILDVSILEAVALVGKSGLTRTKDLRVALEKHGYVCSPRLKVGFPKDDGLYILKVRYEDRKNTHWVVMIKTGEDETYHDPGLLCATGALIHGQVSSYMLVST